MTDVMTPGVAYDTLRSILTFFDNLFFKLLQGVYQVFFNVSTAELFSNSLIREFYFRCQLVIGVFMLFKLSVTILEGIMDPAKVTDKKTGAGKIISRIITSLVILALITPINIPYPSDKWEEQVNNNGILFGALYSLQERILSNNTIGKLILGTTEAADNTDEQGKTLSESADDFAGQILRKFFRINVVPEPEDGYDVEEGLDPEINADYRFCTFTEEEEKFYKKASIEELLASVNDTCGTDSSTPGIVDFVYKEGSKIIGKKVYYRYSYNILGGITALIISIILILYTIDVAIRALKLAILRLIAPIPIISHMSISAKEGKGEDAFSCWVRSLTSTYLELFIRLAIMYFVIFLVNDLSIQGIQIKTGLGWVGALSFIVIIIGMFLFARQAPRFIENSLGIKGAGGGIGATMAAAGLGTFFGGGKLGDVGENMLAASRTVQNGGKDPGKGRLATYRDNQIKDALQKNDDELKREYFKRGLDIDDQDNAGYNNRIRAKIPFLGRGLKKSKLDAAQQTAHAIEQNQKRYRAGWATHERATGRGTTVRGGSEFHTRTDAYPEPTPSGEQGIPPSGPTSRQRGDAVDQSLGMEQEKQKWRKWTQNGGSGYAGRRSESQKENNNQNGQTPQLPPPSSNNQNGQP